MWMTKGCNRCGGDLYKTTTEDGDVLTCLQCGREFLARPRRMEMTPEEMYALFHEDQRHKVAA